MLRILIVRSSKQGKDMQKKILKYQRCLLVVFFLAGSFSSCSSAPPPPPSGFLEDYAGLYPSRGDEEASVYVVPSKDLYFYKMIMLDSIEAYPGPDSRAKRIDPHKLQEITRLFKLEVQKAMDKSYPIVHEPAFGVMRVRMAITNLRPSSPFFPSSVSLLGVELKDSFIEVEILDARTGERLVAFVDSTEGERYEKILDGISSGRRSNGLSAWAFLLKNRMDEARGVHSADIFATSGTSFQYKSSSEMFH